MCQEVRVYVLAEMQTISMDTNYKYHETLLHFRFNRCGLKSHNSTGIYNAIQIYIMSALYIDILIVFNETTARSTTEILNLFFVRLTGLTLFFNFATNLLAGDL